MTRLTVESPAHYCHCHNWRFDLCPNTEVATLMRGGIVRIMENPRAVPDELEITHETGDIHPSGGGFKDYSRDDTPFGDPDSQEGDAD